jgi:hypothetical protein
MSGLRRNNDGKRAARTAGKGKASQNDVVTAQTPVEKEHLPVKDKNQSPSFSTQAVLSDDEFRARVARKAYELYQKRQALTEKDDWLQAEHLVRLELLSEEHGAGSV